MFSDLGAASFRFNTEQRLNTLTLKINYDFCLLICIRISKLQPEVNDRSWDGIERETLKISSRPTSTPSPSYHRQTLKYPYSYASDELLEREGWSWGREMTFLEREGWNWVTSYNQIIYPFILVQYIQI